MLAGTGGCQAAIGKRATEIQQLETKLGSFIPSIQSAMAETAAKLESEEQLRSAGLEKVERAMDSLTEELGSKVAEAAVKERIGKLEAELKAMVLEVKDGAQQEDQVLKDGLTELLGWGLGQSNV